MVKRHKKQQEQETAAGGAAIYEAKVEKETAEEADTRFTPQNLTTQPHREGGQDNRMRHH